MAKSPHVWVFTDLLAMANCLTIWSDRRAIESWSSKWMPIWFTALWKCKGCSNIGHIVTQWKNSLPGSESDGNWQADIPMYSLKVAIWLHEMHQLGGTATMQRRAESRHSLLTPSEAQNINKNCFVCQQKRWRLQMAMWQISCGEDPEHSWQVKLMLVALTEYKQFLTGIDTNSGLGFA